MRYATFLLVLTISLTMACNKPGPADLVLKGGQIITVDNNFALKESVAVRDGKIVFVGSNRGIENYIYPNTTVLDCTGLCVLPGLVDAHAHLHSLGEELTALNVTGTRSYREIINKVAARVNESQPGEWILGGRWDQNDWDERTFPVHDKLSAVSPHNPVFLMRVDGNAGFANLKALEMAGITKDTPDPFGGVIVRKADGSPTGVLVNRAMDTLLARIPEDSEERYREKFLKAVNSCLKVGLTGVHEAGVGPQAIAMYKDLIDRNQLKIRIYAMLGEEKDLPADIDLVRYFREHRIEEYGQHMLSVRSIKLFLDGALGSRGAAFFEPYADDPDNSGLLRITPEYIYQVSKAALIADMGVNTHCIGIRGNSLCLDAYERAFKEKPKTDHRFRIEHAQIVRKIDVLRFASLGVIPAMQPTHCTSDMSFVETRVGMARSEGAYAWRWFLEAGLVIPCGSDFPVESNNPFYGLYAAVTRQDRLGRPEGGWHPEQRMTIQEAIKGFTIWAAYAAFQEDVLGSIEVGKYADFTVVDRNILKVKPQEILESKVAYTIIGGKIRYRSE